MTSSQDDSHKDSKNYAALREYMVRTHIASRGIESPVVLEAMRRAPRELFVPEDMREFAYEDAPLPIGEEQTISQPFIVALMVDALGLRGGEKVLDVGTGSGYAAAVVAEIASEVFSIERLDSLARRAQEALRKAGYENVHVKVGDGTKGWPENAPYDAIMVAAGGPEIPQALKEQLKVGGRLVIPVGDDPRVQELVRVTRVSEDEWRTEELADVRFVPLIGEEGWAPAEFEPLFRPEAAKLKKADHEIAAHIAAAAEPFDSPEAIDLAPLMKRIGGAKVVLLGEATHGTCEFYRMRAEISKRLVTEKGIRFIGLEADWPDAARLDHYVRHFEHPPGEWTAFARFPTWMWRNEEFRDFIEWLREHNRHLPPKKRVAIYGLDLYAMFNSIQSIIDYLEQVNPELAKLARERYACLTPWQKDASAYGRAALSGEYRICEDDVVAMLVDLLKKRSELVRHDGERFLDAVQNARLIANAEKYYRVMYYGSRASWNLRDQHMFDTLRSLLDFHGPEAKGAIWAHNSHLGDATATEMSARGEYNIGHLCREEFGAQSYAIGFGTHGGTVAAASMWDGEMEVKEVKPSHPKSYEILMHDSGVKNFLLPMRSGDKPLMEQLAHPRLERAIGVIYRPDTELASHYFQAILPHQFDEYCWFDTTRAVAPLEAKMLEGVPETYPFGV